MQQNQAVFCRSRVHAFSDACLWIGLVAHPTNVAVPGSEWHIPSDNARDG
jgi:hypothetical protein